LFASYSTVEKCVSIGRHLVLSDINIGRIFVLANTILGGTQNQQFKVKLCACKIWILII